MTLLMSPFQHRAFLIALLVAAALSLMSVKVRADEPTRYYLEDGKVTAKKFAEQDRRIDALEKEVAALRAEKAKAAASGSPGSYGPGCPCAVGECPCARSTAAIEPDVCDAAGFPMRLTADGRHYERVPGAASRPERVIAGYSPPAAVLPSYAPTVLPAASCPGGVCSPAGAQYVLPAAGVTSCPNGRCPIR